MEDFDTAPYLLDEDGTPQVFWRGESSGIHYDQFDLSKTDCRVGFFFAEVKQQADQYAARGTDARSFHLCSRKTLDLTDVYTKEAIQFIREYSAEFDEWVDRRSGEEEDVGTLIECGYLYDYEGNGSGERWNHLFRMANGLGYDAVRVMDATDGITAPVCVVFDPKQIMHADIAIEPANNRRGRYGR
jgi:hypothetical protein